MKVSNASIEDVSVTTLRGLGVDSNEARIITDTILFANRTGNPAHGIGRLPLYIRKVESHHMDPLNKMEWIMDSGAVSLLDACNGFGQVAAFRAMERAVSKAHEFGISAAGVRHSNNFGMAGFFGRMAAEHSCAVMIFTNAAPAIAPPGGGEPIFGTNPICFAFPGGEGSVPVILDMATTVAARGKIRLAAKNKEKIPVGWAVDAEGCPTDDPFAALEGSLLPIGGYKGFGLAMFVDIFSGLMTGAGYGGNVQNLANTKENSNTGHLMIVIDVNRFMGPNDPMRLTADFVQKVRECGRPGQEIIPGENWHRAYAEHEQFSVIGEKQFREINEEMVRLMLPCRLKEV